MTPLLEQQLLTAFAGLYAQSKGMAGLSPEGAANAAAAIEQALAVIRATPTPPACCKQAAEQMRESCISIPRALAKRLADRIAERGWPTEEEQAALGQAQEIERDIAALAPQEGGWLPAAEVMRDSAKKLDDLATDMLGRNPRNVAADLRSVAADLTRALPAPPGTPTTQQENGDG